jgi:hypothetical protein
MSSGLIIMLGLIYAGFSALGIAAGASIVRKAGYSPWWVVTGFIPLLNVVMVFTFAFADWPILQENRREHRLRGYENKGHPNLYAAAGLQPTGVAPSGVLPAEVVPADVVPADVVPADVVPALYDPAAAVPPAPPLPAIPTYPRHRAAPSAPIPVPFIAQEAVANERPYGT